MDVCEKLTHAVAFTVVVVTLFLPVGVCFMTLRRTRSQTDFFVGGRAINRLVVALPAVSSGRSSWLVLDVSGMAYTMGVSAVWAISGYMVAELFQFIYLGRRLREGTQKFGSITVLE